MPEQAQPFTDDEILVMSQTAFADMRWGKMVMARVFATFSALKDKLAVAKQKSCIHINVAGDCSVKAALRDSNSRVVDSMQYFYECEHERAGALVEALKEIKAATNLPGKDWGCGKVHSIVLEALTKYRKAKEREVAGVKR